MKKKINPQKFVLGAAATASLAVPVGCSSDLPVEVNPKEARKNDSNSALSMKMLFSNDDVMYFNYLFSLTDNIIENPQVASDFVGNPSNYLRRAGFENDFTIDKDDPNLQAILALGDSEIRERLESQDLKGFMALCKQKGYAVTYSGNFLNWLNAANNGTLSPNLLKSTGVGSVTQSYEQDCLFPIVVAAAAAVYTIYYYYNLTHTHTKVKYKWGVLEQFSVDQPALAILLLSEDEKKAYYACEDYIADEVKIIVDYVKSENPQFTYAEEVELTNFLKKNLVNINQEITE